MPTDNLRVNLLIFRIRRLTMMMEIIMEITQKQFEKAESGQAVEIAKNGKEFILIRRDLYDRLKHVLGYDDSELTPEEMAQAAWEAGKRIGWDDPEMDIYDDYEKHRP